jgi:hypothetical protein
MMMNLLRKNSANIFICARSMINSKEVQISVLSPETSAYTTRMIKSTHLGQAYAYFPSVAATTNQLLHGKSQYRAGAELLFRRTVLFTMHC